MHWIFALVLQHWLLVNDVHFDPFSRAGVVYGADTTADLWRSATAAMRRDAPDTRVVLLGGDMLAHHFAHLANAAHASAEGSSLAAVRTIANGLQSAFPHAQFLVALGNNDDPCGDYRSDAGGAYLAQLAKIWAPMVDRAGAAPDFAKQFAQGGYYTARLPIRDGRAIVLNSVFWSILYSGGCFSRPHNPGAAELAWLRAQLEELPRNANAVLLMHMPPGFDPHATQIVHNDFAVPFLHESTNRAFLAAVAARAGSLRFIVAAHTHRYNFRIADGVPVIVGASISPVYRNNPAFFVLDVDATNGELRNVHPYIYNPDTMQWTAAPSFDAMYGSQSLNAQNLLAVNAKIRSDAAVRARWSAAYNTWGVDDRMPAAWVPFACAQTELGSGFAACAGTANRTRVLVLVAAGMLLCFIVGASLLLRRASRIR